LTQTLRRTKAKASPPPPPVVPDDRVEALRTTIIFVLEDAKAEDVASISLAGRTALADHMVIASGRSDRHVGAIAEQIMHKLKDAGFGSARVEGMPLNEWVLIDTGDVIVHIFKPEARSFYNLEKIWSGDRPDEKSSSRH
jgi:ribosome-associated protein